MKVDKEKMVFMKGSNDIFKEIKRVIKLCFGDDFIYQEFEVIYGDIIRLFRGNFPGYQASKTKYHDLDHTQNVALGTIRLIHGALIAGEKITPREGLIALAAALFHDSGLIQKKEEPKIGTGAKYTIGHEKRSEKFMREYLKKRDAFSEEDIKMCESIIELTNLNITPDKLDLKQKDVKLIHEIVATSDIVSQMADRVYLEKLKYLFQEFIEAGIDAFSSEYDLLAKTENFYNMVTKTRVEKDLENVERFAKYHFKELIGEETDFYMKSIDRNLRYLRIVINKAGNNYDRFLTRELLE